MDISALKFEVDLKRHANAELLAEVERLREALTRLLDMDVAYKRGPAVEEAVEAARAALAGTQPVEPSIPVQHTEDPDHGEDA